jgi:hypothetical protein
MNDDRERAVEPDLRPVIARLREIQRRCDAMGSRNEEFPQMEERLAAIIKRLEAGEEESGEPLRFGAVAREIFPVAHLFESYGFLGVGKEVAHVERALRELASEEEDAWSSTSGAGHLPEIPSETVHPSNIEGEEQVEIRTAVPRPVIVGLAVLVLACALAAAVVLLRTPVQRDFVTEQPLTPAPEAAYRPPEAQPTKPTRDHGSVPNPSAQLAEAVGKARLALNRGDLEASIDHLSAAALIDVDDTSVLDTAQRVVDALVGAANAAADHAEWQLAEERLERARRLALRFGISTVPIETARRRHAAIERFRLLTPADPEAILAATGDRVVVIMLDGSQREGRVHGVEDRMLLLDVDSDVGGGGTMRYTDEIPLATVRELRAYND